MRSSSTTDSSTRNESIQSDAGRSRTGPDQDMAPVLQPPSTYAVSTLRSNDLISSRSLFGVRLTLSGKSRRAGYHRSLRYTRTREWWSRSTTARRGGLVLVRQRNGSESYECCGAQLESAHIREDWTPCGDCGIESHEGEYLVRADGRLVATPKRVVRTLEGDVATAVLSETLGHRS